MRFWQGTVTSEKLNDFPIVLYQIIALSQCHNFMDNPKKQIIHRQRYQFGIPRTIQNVLSTHIMPSCSQSKHQCTLKHMVNLKQGHNVAKLLM